MNLGEILTFVYADLGYSSTPPSAISAKFTRWINQGHRMILREPGMVDLRFTTLPFTSAAGVGVYGLPQAFESINAIVQESSQRRLRYMSRDRFRTFDPGETSSGIPDFWIPGGLQPVLRQPAATGSGVWVVSDNAADTTQTVYFEGIRLNGDIQAIGSVSLNGTTRAAIQSTITDFVQIMMWNLSAVAAGNVSLYDAASNGNLLARIPIGAKAVQYQSVRLWPTPADAYAFVIDGRAEITDLTNATDVPLIPPSYHDLLGAYCRMKEYETKQDSRYQIAQTEWDEGFAELRASIQYPPDYRPIAGTRQGVGILWPNLAGGYYPADFEWP